MSNCNRDGNDYQNVPLPGIRKVEDQASAQDYDILEADFAATPGDDFTLVIPSNAVRFELRTAERRPANMKKSGITYRITAARVFESGPLALESDLTLTFTSAYTGAKIQAFVWTRD